MENFGGFDWLQLLVLMKEISPLGAVVLIALASISVCLFSLFVVLKIMLEAKK